jgi:hypothetical protein
MGYIHKGKVMINGTVDPGPVPADTYELTVKPEDDGLQIVDFTRGDFEWWYFDINDQVSGCFLKIVVHIGTDPLRTRVFPQLAISINTREKSESFFHPFNFSEMHADTGQCNISVGDKIKIRTDFNEHFDYLIETDIPEFKCNFRFKGCIEGWKPFGNKLLYQSGKKKGDFSWVIPMPKAMVDGYFFYENRKYTITSAIGYHDHNYIKVDRKYPLYLDALAIKWYWGKFYADRFTVIFADIYSMTNRTLSLMVAEQNKVIHSSNNLIDCSVSTSGYDSILKVKYPASLEIKSLDEHFPFRAELEFDKILDRKDLLEGVNPVLKYLIKKLVAKPVYHGISAKARLEISNIRLEGYGNFESMVFRSK